jgi:uncharacterized DUF497 family protein
MEANMRDRDQETFGSYGNLLTDTVFVSTLFLVNIEFDPAKDAKNVADRGISLATAIELFQGVCLEAVDNRDHYGEVRVIAYGHIDGRLHVCVYTDRGDVRRIISLRKANAREKSWFDRQIEA